MTKRIPNPKRLLDMEERLLTRLQQERDAAYAVFREKDTALMRQRQIVALKRGERPPLAEWTPDGEYRPFRTESLVGQPGVAQVPVLTDNAPNGGAFGTPADQSLQVGFCEAPRHYFSAAPNLPIGTPCFCGARAWGVDPAKEGAKP